MHWDARAVAVGLMGWHRLGCVTRGWRRSVSYARVVGMLGHSKAGSPPGADGLQVSPRCPGCWCCACCPWSGSARALSAVNPCSQPSPTASSHPTMTTTQRSSTMVWPSLTWMLMVTLRSWWQGEWCTQCLGGSGTWWTCKAGSFSPLPGHVAVWGVVHNGDGGVEGVDARWASA